MSDNVAISIIIPVYNEEKLLVRCLNSVVKQSMHNIEVVVVDDASTDATGEVIKDYEKKYPSLIKGISLKKNRHQGGARNVGLRYAKGEYIMFVDSDDYIDENMCEMLYKKAKEKNVPCVALELNNDIIITGKKSELFEATAAAIINALKYYAKIPDDITLLSPTIIEPICELKSRHLHKLSRLCLDEVLISLAITASTNSMAKKALEQLHKLKGSQMHSSEMLHKDEISTLKKIGIDVTTEPVQDSMLLQR